MTLSAVSARKNEALQFRGLVQNVLVLEATWAPGSVGSNSFVQEDMTVPGVRLGDQVMANVAADLQNLILFVHVKAANTINVHLFNPTPGGVDLGSVDLHVTVFQLYHH